MKSNTKVYSILFSMLLILGLNPTAAATQASSKNAGDTIKVGGNCLDGSFNCEAEGNPANIIAVGLLAIGAGFAYKAVDYFFPSSEESSDSKNAKQKQ